MPRSGQLCPFGAMTVPGKGETGQYRETPCRVLVPEGVISPMASRSSSMISPNLTPLLDVVLQLITFFMMLVHFGSRLEGSNRAVRLPVAPAALPGSDLTFDRLPVSLDQRGGLRYGGRVLLGAAASAWWAEQAKIRRAG